MCQVRTQFFSNFIVLANRCSLLFLLNWERGKGAVVCLQLDGDIENLKMDHSCRNRNVNLLSLFLA